MTREKKTTIITGASSGLGAALAVKYSRNGHRLFLLARSKERLDAVAKICAANGAEANIFVVDVADSTQMEKQLNEIAYKYGIDIVIACAGVSAGTLDGPEAASQVQKIFATNINGVINTVLPVIPHMIERRSGNIVIVSSMAGFLGLSSAPSYSASKGAVRLFSEALRGYLRVWGVSM
jgi:short-subunit dehydrogenase